MSLQLFNMPGKSLRTEAVTSSNDVKESIIEGGCKVELHRSPLDMSHLSAYKSAGFTAAFQPEKGIYSTEEAIEGLSGESDSDMEEVQFPVQIGGASLGMSQLGTPFDPREDWTSNGLYPTMETMKAVVGESDSHTGELESPVEELVSAFATRFCFARDGSKGRLGEDNFHGCSQSKVEKNEEGGHETPYHIVEFNVAKQEKSEESKAKHQNISTAGTLLKGGMTLDPTLGSAGVLPFSMENRNTGNPQAECSGESEEVSQNCMVGSTKPKSALRGGHEELGLGPRPKLHVRWAPDVLEPACTSASHTVYQSHRRHHSKKDHKHRHKGKSSHGDSRKKHEKKLSHKSRYISEAFVFRTPVTASPKVRQHSNLQEVALAESLVLPYDEQSLKNVTLSSVMLPQKSSAFSGVLQLGERRHVKLDQRIPLSWQIQTHKLRI